MSPESRVLVVLARIISGLAGLETVDAGGVVVGGGAVVVLEGWVVVGGVVDVTAGEPHPAKKANAIAVVTANSHFLRITGMLRLLISVFRHLKGDIQDVPYGGGSRSLGQAIGGSRVNGRRTPC
jgi:hypothetical protein